MRRYAWLRAWLMAAVCCGLVSPAAAAPFRVGLNMVRFEPGGGGAHDELHEVFPDMVSIGAQGIRQFTSYDLSWHSLYQGGPYGDEASYDFTDADAAILNAQGLVTIPTLFQIGGTSAVIGGAPDDKALYTPDGDVVDVSQPMIEAAVRDYVRVVAERYGANVTHFEIANEVAGYANYSALQYAALLQVCADELHAVDPNFQLVLGGLAGTVSVVLTNHSDWLDQVLAAGAGPAIDVLNFHFYDRWEQMQAGIEYLSTILDSRGLGDRPLWATEIGSSYIASAVAPHQSDGSEVEQAADVFRKFSVAFGNGADLVLWHTYKGNSESPGFPWSGFGLRTSADVVKPSYYSFGLFAERLGSFSQVVALSQGEGGVWAYRYEIEEAGIAPMRWVLWTDQAAGVVYDLGDSSADQVNMTSVLPDSSGAFTASLGSARGLPLSTTPLLVEPVAASVPAAGPAGWLLLAALVVVATGWRLGPVHA